MVEGEVLVALADPTRRRILDIVAARGEATATVLADEVPISRQAIVKHLAVLERAGLDDASRGGLGREARRDQAHRRRRLSTRRTGQQVVSMLARASCSA
jgi:DNA-binding transcriptional ArsR family regulator